MTPQAVITKARRKLHDLTGHTWTEAELLDWVRDAVVHLLSKADSALTFSAYDLPPRETWAYTYEWERELLNGPSRKFTYTRRDKLEATQLFETQDIEDGTDLTTGWNVSYLWELGFVSADSDVSYKVLLPKESGSIRAVWFDNERVPPTNHITLDNSYNDWWKLEGEPVAWTSTVGRSDEFVLYEIVKTYSQSYNTLTSSKGMPRSFSGDRTYEVGSDSQYGIARQVIASDKQYFAHKQWEIYGIPRKWVSSDDGLLVWHSVTLDADQILIDKEITALPAILHKYIVYFVLYMAFNQRGEGYAPNIASHYLDRYQRAFSLLNRLQNSTHMAASYSRSRNQRSGKKITWPRLPANFEQPRRLV